MSKLSEQIKQALEAATPGPWNSTGDAVRLDYGLDGWICQMFEGDENSDSPTREFNNARSNSHLIANAPTWLSQLLQEREQMVEALKSIESIKYDNLYYCHEDAECMNGIARDILKQVGELE